MIAFLALSVVIPMVIVYRMAPRTPRGQQSLVYFEAEMMPILREDFNRAASQTRVFVFLSPTDPQAAGAAQGVESALQAKPGSAVKVFLIWQPLSAADRRGPPNPLLSLVRDSRVAQFFDIERVLAGQLKPSAAVLVFDAGAKWENAPPSPSWSGPVSGLGQHLQ